MLKVDLWSDEAYMKIMLKKGDIYTTPDRPYANAEEETVDNCKGKVMDLVFPILVTDHLVCICGMIYTGGFFRRSRFCRSIFRK